MAFSMTARGRGLGALPSIREGIRIPRETKKNEATKIVMKSIFLFMGIRYKSGEAPLSWQQQ